MLRYGCTRLEIGVQSVYEDVARDTNRGVRFFNLEGGKSKILTMIFIFLQHTVRAVCEAFQLAKDAGCKFVCHKIKKI